MAPLSLLLSFLAKKIGTILQAVFGWSITALFGRLDSKRELAVTAALVVSLAWPIFVVGLFFPGVAAWALAFLPLKHWVSASILRFLWAGLALTAPLLVGALVHWAAPATKGSWLRTLIGGYPLAVAFFAAFVVTAVTVPIVKAITIVRGWDDTHVHVQAREGKYDEVVHALAEACARAGLMPAIERAPRSMTIAANILRSLAKGLVRPILADDLRMIRAKDIEVYLYPSDLLIRGPATQVALVRAMMTRTKLDAIAFLVPSPAGRALQDRLGGLAEALERHIDNRDEPGALFGRMLVAVWKDLNEAKLKFEEWVLLESITRRLERRYAKITNDVDALRIDDEPDGIDRLEDSASRLGGSLSEVGPGSSRLFGATS